MDCKYFLLFCVQMPAFTLTHILSDVLGLTNNFRHLNFVKLSLSLSTATLLLRLRPSAGLITQWADLSL